MTAGRFERFTSQAIDDGWGAPEEPLPPLRTQVREERARSIVARNTSPDVPFDRSINPYRGCEHGCIYCFARPSHAFLGLSPGLDFETRLTAKPNAAELLARELARPRYDCASIAIWHQYRRLPAHREGAPHHARGARGAGQRTDHPVGIVTKGTLIERDIDILAPMAAQGLVRVGISVTTLDPAVVARDGAARAQPRAAIAHDPTASRRPA